VSEDEIAAIDARKLANIMEYDFIDFPTAWAIQRTYGDSLQHDPRCSSVPGWCAISGPALLCDCGAIEKKWIEIRATGSPVAGAWEGER